MNRLTALAAILIIGLFALTSPARGATYTFTTIDYPSANQEDGGGTRVTGINNEGQVVGCSGTTCFAYSDGVFATLPDDPSGYYYTTFSGINDRGQLVGSYEDVTGVVHGFLYSDRVFTTIDDPSATLHTYASGINDRGQVVGYYLDANANNHGFLYRQSKFTTIDDPSGAGNTYPSGINDSGKIVGAYLTTEGINYGFEYSRGLFTTIDDPSAVEGFEAGTLASGINNKGQIVGWYTEKEGFFTHGFVFSDGVYRTIDAPLAGSGVLGGTWAYGINDSGKVAGYYVDTENVHHGFIATPTGFVGCNGATFSGNAMVDSYNSKDCGYAFHEGFDDGNGSDGNVQTCTADANITLSGKAAIYGSASATGSVISSGLAKVYGDTSQNQPACECDPLNVVSLVASKRPSSNPTTIRLNGSKTETLAAPGTFNLTGVSLSGDGVLTIYGSGNATMFIDGDLSISGRASFIVSPGVELTIYITGNISISGGGMISQRPHDLIIYASATNGSKVAIRGNSEFSGALYAPLSDISVTGNSSIRGAVRGITVTGSGNAGFHYDEGTGTLLSGW